MRPILTSQQIREADAHTIENEPITSVNLMERAATAFTQKFLDLNKGLPSVAVVCGVGNNGGDGLAIARMLTDSVAEVKVFVVGNLEKASEDFRINYDRLGESLQPVLITSAEHIPKFEESCVIDGLFGSGLSRPVEGLHAQVIEQINASHAQVCAIDIPSGLYADKPSPSDGTIVKADFTISFQLPKHVFFMPTCAQYVGEWHVVPIGLSDTFIEQEYAEWWLTEASDIQLPLKSVFDHKGTNGRVMIVAGSKGRMGAAVLCTRAALRAGSGLLFAHVPCCGLDIMQGSVPEAMVEVDEHTEIISEVLPNDSIDVIAIGPGIGTGKLTENALAQLLQKAKEPMVLDADGLNILAKNHHFLSALPPKSILTPHPGEFSRLVGEWKNDFEKLEKLQAFCKQYQVNVVLKGAYSVVCSTAGKLYFNPTGNPGMATGGSGDVLTGVVASFLGQGMEPFHALRAAVYIHGLAGDLAAAANGMRSMTASDIISCLSEAIKQFE